MKKQKSSVVAIHMEDGLIEAVDGLPEGTRIQILDYTLNFEPDFEPCTCKLGMRDHAHREMICP